MEFGMDMNSEIFEQELYMSEEPESEDADDVIILHMDIREPLRSLQKLIEQKIGINMKGYKFWLQDAQELEPHKNLVDQCVKGEGLVQINVQIQTINQRINIVDVLKPTEAALAALTVEEQNKATVVLLGSEQSEDSEATCNETDEKKLHIKPKASSSSTGTKDKPCLNWVLDNKFKKEQLRLKIPEDPTLWTIPQVKHWFQWAVRQFELSGFSIADWSITGKQLCTLTHEEFRKKLPNDPGNVFWTHLQLLKECKFVSVVHKAAEDGTSTTITNPLRFTNSKTQMQTSKEQKIMRKSSTLQAPTSSDGSPLHQNSIIASPVSTGQIGPGGNNSNYGIGSGNNGQVQLWQFLLEILTDREHVNIIQWVGKEGEFKLSDPERVARLWGEKKNKPAMNYEKLSRALRYYYDGDMISKVSGKRFAYKFDCDLKLLIGYDASELSELVNEKSDFGHVHESMYLDHINSTSDDE